MAVEGNLNIDGGKRMGQEKYVAYVSTYTIGDQREYGITVFDVDMEKGRFHEYSSEFWGTLLYGMIICPRRWKVNGSEKEGVDKGSGMWYTIQVTKISAYRGVEQLEARRAHNPEAAGSSPASATITTA